MTKTAGRWSLGRIITLCLVGALSLAWVLFGCLALLGGAIITGFFVVVYFLCPTLLFFGCLFLLRSRMRILWKIILCVLLAAVIILTAFYLFIFGHYVYDYASIGEEAEEEYNRIEETIFEFPALGELGQYNRIEYHEFIDQAGPFFIAENHILLCQYSEAEYTQQLHRLHETYSFQSEPLSAHGYTCDPTITIDGDCFQLLSIDTEHYPALEYPKRLFFIVTNEDTQEIGYLLFRDDDLDYIADLENHLLNACGWRYIR